MRRRRSERSARLGQREAERMLNLAGSHFVIAHQARKNRQSGRVGGGPGVGPLLVAQQIPHRGRIGIPAPVGIHRRVVEFVEKTIAVVEHEHVAIAGTGRTAFDRSTLRNRHGSGIALAPVRAEIHIHQRLAAIDHDVGNAVGRIVAPVGMNVHRADPVADNRVGIRVDGRGRDIGVPKTVAGEGNKAVQTGGLAHRHPTAGEIAATRTAAGPATGPAPPCHRDLTRRNRPRGRATAEISAERNRQSFAEQGQRILPFSASGLRSERGLSDMSGFQGRSGRKNSARLLDVIPRRHFPFRRFRGSHVVVLVVDTHDDHMLGRRVFPGFRRDLEVVVFGLRSPTVGRPARRISSRPHPRKIRRA